MAGSIAEQRLLPHHREDVGADFRDPYVADLIERDGWALWPPVRYSYNTVDYAYEVSPSPPDRKHFFGTDGGGTDVFAKLLYGFRLSVLFGLATDTDQFPHRRTRRRGAGLLRGLIDLLGQRVVDIFAGLPILFLLICSSFSRASSSRTCYGCIGPFLYTKS